MRLGGVVVVIAGLLLTGWGVQRLTGDAGCHGRTMRPGETCTNWSKRRLRIQTYEQRRSALHVWGAVFVATGSLTALGGVVVFGAGVARSRRAH
jgi:hypothetical protein